MFGHLDDEQNNSDQTGVGAPPQPTSDNGAQGQSDQPSHDNNDANDDNSVGYLDHLASDTPEHHDDNGANQPDEHHDDNASEQASASDDGASNNDDNASAPLADDKLLDIKKQALGELSPLVSHLEQSPEEKFKTTMMMIQAADNQALIPEAYAAAKDISDEKARAQALLDIVNEINYFTHKATS